MARKTELTDAFANGIQQWIPVEKSYLVAVSGGRDSMALLHFLHEAGYKNLFVCHVNHQMRGEDSDLDEKLVEGQADRLGYRYESTGIDVPSFASENRLSLETAARDLRYGWLAEVATQQNCPRVITAHHADDQVETVLMNLFRGTGSRGLAGIANHSTRVVGGVSLELFRPLLDVPRVEIDRYLEANQIPFRDDESNLDEFALRNRVRHRLMPILQEVFGRDVTSAVLKAAELARRQEAWADQEVGEIPRFGNGLDVRALREMPEAKRDRIVLSWLREEGVSDCGYDEVERVAAVLLSNDRPAKANLPGGFHIRRREGVLFLEAPEKGT